jgi:hypothetical protein
MEHLLHSAIFHRKAADLSATEWFICLEIPLMLKFIGRTQKNGDEIKIQCHDCNLGLEQYLVKMVWPLSINGALSDGIRQSEKA